MIVRVAGIFVVGLVVLATGASPGQTPTTNEPESYRSENYRSATPLTLRGARVISTTEAQAIWRAGSAAFVDVLPHVPRPPDLPIGTLWQGQRRLNIAGSIWLAGTGYGELSAAAEGYFRSGLQGATGGNGARPVVIYRLRN